MKTEPKKILVNGAIEVAADELEKVIFPKPPLTLGGKILRILFKIGKIFIPK
jgi:hypothetical protein